MHPHQYTQHTPQPGQLVKVPYYSSFHADAQPRVVKIGMLLKSRRAAFGYFEVLMEDGTIEEHMHFTDFDVLDI